MKLNDIADALRRAGLSVTEVPGWQARGHGDFKAVKGVMAHHTAGPATGNYPSLSVVRSGRAGLAGPLANLGLARDGSVLVIAAGVAWHAGAGQGFGLPKNGANAYMIGVEAESTGKGDWTPAQVAAYPKLLAALSAHYGFPRNMIVAHAEWAPGRKIDPAGFPGGMAALRGGATNPASPVSNPQPGKPARNIAQTKATQAAVHVTQDGYWGDLTEQGITRVRLAINGNFPDVKAAQRVVGTTADGIWGPKSRAALTATVKKLQAAWGTTADGIWGPKTEAAWIAAKGRNYKNW